MSGSNKKTKQTAPKGARSSSIEAPTMVELQARLAEQQAQLAAEQRAREEAQARIGEIEQELEGSQKQRGREGVMAQEGRTAKRRTRGLAMKKNRSQRKKEVGRRVGEEER